MAIELPGSIKYVKYWRYLPDRLQRTRVRTVRSERVLSSIRMALSEPMEELELYAEDPLMPRYLVLAYHGNRRKTGIKVLEDVLVVKNQCFQSKTGLLHQIIDSLPKGELETLSRQCPVPLVDV